MADQDISFATFNLLNLQRAGAPTYPDARAITEAEERAKIKWVGARLRDLDADVIGFQEVWSADMLAACFEEVNLDDDYDLVARDAPPGRVQVAAAVRRGLLREGGAWITDFPPALVLKKRQPQRGEAVEAVDVRIGEFSRPPLRFEVHPDITVFVAHLKSKRGVELDRQEADDPEVKIHRVAIGSALATVRRVAEAAALRVLLTSEMKGNRRPAVVVGDLNDATQSVSTTIITAEPGYRVFASSQVGSSSDIGLYTVAELQELRSLRDVYYTYIYKHRHESLDHILVSEQFYDHSRNRRWSFRDMTVWNDHLSERGPPGASDHAVVRARFVRDPA